MHLILARKECEYWYVSNAVLESSNFKLVQYDKRHLTQEAQSMRFSYFGNFSS